MPLYEHTFLARHDLSAQQMEALMDKFSSVLKENGGRVIAHEYWGLKPLSYRIKKNRKAHFGFLQVETPPAAIAEMERQMGISNDVLRFLTVRVEAHETLPSAQMRKSDRDERKGRRGRFEDFGDDKFES
jgi:small subunit ribosomal protein S6